MASEFPAQRDSNAENVTYVKVVCPVCHMTKRCNASIIND